MSLKQKSLKLKICLQQQNNSIVVEEKILCMFNFFIPKKKKQRPSCEPVVEKDWQSISERLEKKVIAIEAETRALQNTLRDKDKQILLLQEEKSAQERLVQQEKRWREKEAFETKKEKEREKEIVSELNQTRESWQTQQALRIKFEQEARELRTQKDALTLEHQRTVNALEAKEKEINLLLKDIKDLKFQNSKLTQKKEADQWVAKADFIRLEKILKRERRELVLFKTQVPQSAWPKELRPLREKALEQQAEG